MREQRWSRKDKVFGSCQVDRGCPLHLGVGASRDGATARSPLTQDSFLRRTLMVPISDIVKPGFTTVVVGEGMPKPSGGRGDLVLEVEVLFPMGLSETQKMLLKAAFFLPAGENGGATPGKDFKDTLSEADKKALVEAGKKVPLTEAEKRLETAEKQAKAVREFEKAFKDVKDGWSKHVPTVAAPKASS